MVVLKLLASLPAASGWHCCCCLSLVGIGNSDGLSVFDSRAEGEFNVGAGCGNTGDGCSGIIDLDGESSADAVAEERVSL